MKTEKELDEANHYQHEEWEQEYFSQGCVGMIFLMGGFVSIILLGLVIRWIL